MAAIDDYEKRKAFIASFIGVYNFEHPGGKFEVHLRSDERFFAPLYQTKSTWCFDAAGKLMTIDFAKYGVYELNLEDETAKSFSGSAKGKPENWRKMSLKRPFSKAEMMLFDSVWDFQHPGGSFPVEFRADAYNHFICNDFPTHSHWKCVLAAPPARSGQPHCVLARARAFSVRLPDAAAIAVGPQDFERRDRHSQGRDQLGQIWHV